MCKRRDRSNRTDGTDRKIPFWHSREERNPPFLVHSSCDIRLQVICHHHERCGRRHKRLCWGHFLCIRTDLPRGIDQVRIGKDRHGAVSGRDWVWEGRNSPHVRRSNRLSEFQVRA